MQERASTAGGQIRSGGTQISATDEVAQTLRDVQTQAEKIQKEIDQLEQASKASPLSDKISIGKVSRGSTGSVSEYVILKAANTNTEKLLITGLRLESSASGRGVDIPKGVQLPFQNQVNVEQPIYLAAGETAYIITGRSPLGTSFRLNKCTGFFSQFQSFIPSIPGRCPLPSSEPLTKPTNQYNDQCLDYISTLRKCQVVTKPPTNISPECQKYVTTEINYTKCVERHKNDKDFYDPEWRVYLNRDDTLWKSNREVIYLYDGDHRVIDAVTY